MKKAIEKIKSVLHPKVRIVSTERRNKHVVAHLSSGVSLWALI